MARVTFRRFRLARMTARTLPIIDAAGERLAVQRTVALRMRLVTVHAGHAAVEVTRAEEVTFLVGERARSAIRQQRVTGRESVLQRMTTQAQLHGSLLRQRDRTRRHAVASASLRVAPRGTMTRLAI